MISCPTEPWAGHADVVASDLRTDPDPGLAADEVARRLEAFGWNELEQAAVRPAWRRLLDQFTDPLVLLLFAAIGISLIAWLVDGGSGSPVEVIVIAVIVVANAAIGFWQEEKATKAVDALRELTSTHTRVVRDGEVESIPNRALVPGDIVLLGEGDAIGADCRLIEAATLTVAEAPLTGESTPVEKQTVPIPAETAVAERTNMVFNGTGVVRGRGRAVVTSTGMSTQIGHIATLLDSTTTDPTPLDEQIAWLSRVLGLAVVVLAAVVVAAIFLTSGSTGLSGVIDVLVVGVSLAVAAVPEGLPAILSVVLALGVQRMATQRAVVKRLSSVETLGSASVICTDKTGTLTRNEMSIVSVTTPSITADISGVGYQPIGRATHDGVPLADADLTEVELVLEAGSLANDALLRRTSDGDWEILGDPTEAAFLVAERKLGRTEVRQQRYRRVGEIPFDSRRKLMTTVNTDARPGDAGAGDERGFMLVTKGAPDVLLERCTHERVAGHVLPLTDERRRQVSEQVDGLADRSLRTLAVAYRQLDHLRKPIDESLEAELTLLGVVGMMDPPRPEVSDAIADAHRAGIRVIMITGDHARTAARIGEQLGIETPHSSAPATAITGRELAKLGDDEFADTIANRSVFARVSPEQKLRIVEQLQGQQHIVAMTGDGVNDAPALRQADIGVAMGISGTEVSKEAADMILADDNFATILRAVRDGREIFTDIRKFLRYLLASNTGEVLVMFVGVLAASALGLTAAADAGGQLAVPLLATQILWINLLTDSALALALGVDPPVEDVMSDPPRRITARIIDRSMIVTIALIGSTTALAGLIALDLELPGGLLGGSGDLTSARTMVFTTIVLAQIFNAFNARSDTVSAFVRPFGNRLLWAAAGGTVALQVAVVHAAPLNKAFDTVALDVRQWAVCAALASSVLMVDEIRKLLVRGSSPATVTA